MKEVSSASSLALFFLCGCHLSLEQFLSEQINFLMSSGWQIMSKMNMHPEWGGESGWWIDREPACGPYANQAACSQTCLFLPLPSSSTCSPTVRHPPPSPTPTREHCLDRLAYFFLSTSHGVSSSPLCKEQAPQVFHVSILLFAISCCSYNFSSVHVKNYPFIFLKGIRGC